eukprot:GDKJ01023657.1.p1 GENE.GDKJ01023657.1~~GDKJ01023657.1.p1  ORF type:complete len:1267 (+),score=308.55 GDKJ01023657.1:64-3864(+)
MDPHREYTPTRTAQLSKRSVMETPDSLVTAFEGTPTVSPILQRTALENVDQVETSPPQMNPRKTSVRRLSRKSNEEHDNEVIKDADQLNLFPSDTESESTPLNKHTSRKLFPDDSDEDAESSSDESSHNSSNSSESFQEKDSAPLAPIAQNRKQAPVSMKSNAPSSKPSMPSTNLFDDESDDNYGLSNFDKNKNHQQSDDSFPSYKNDSKNTQTRVSRISRNQNMNESENNKLKTSPKQVSEKDSEKEIVSSASQALTDEELLASIPDCPETLSNGWLWDGESILIPSNRLKSASADLFELHARCEVEKTRNGKYLSHVDGKEVIVCPMKTYHALLPHQRASVAWGLACHLRGEGGLLADDMGLGKTVTSAVVIGLLLKNRMASHIMVCTPLNVMQQWEDEIVKWAPDAEVFKLRGTTDKQRLKTLNEVIESPAGVLLINYDLMKRLSGLLQGIPFALKLDWYREAAAQNKKRFKKLLAKRGDPRRCYELASPPVPNAFIPFEGPGWQPTQADSKDSDIHPLLQTHKETLVGWDAILFDEAHTLKTPTTQVFEGANRIVSNCKLLLSGTPVYNKLDDFWGLLSIAAPGLMGERKTFKQQFTNPITRGLSKDASPFEVALKDELLHKLKNQTSKVILRRTKADLDVQDSSCDKGAAISNERNAKNSLPPKIEMIVWQRMAAIQERIYSAILSTETAIDAMSKVKTDTTSSSQFRLLSWLRKVAVSPFLLLPKGQRPWETDATNFNYYKDLAISRADLNEKKRRDFAERAEISQNRGGVFNGYIEENEESDIDVDVDELSTAMQAVYNLDISTEAIIDSCAKLSFVHRILPSLLKSGHKVLIFSEFVYTLNTVAKVVLEDALQLAEGIDFAQLNGSIPIEERDAIIHKFKSSNQVKVLLASSKVGGVGLNLTVADRIILLEPSWTPAIDSQVVDRVHRIGQKNRVVVYRLACAGTIEDHCLRLQLFKRGVHKATLEKSSRQQRYFKSEEMRGAFKLNNSENAESARLMVAAVENEDGTILDLTTRQGQTEALQSKSTEEKFRKMNCKMAVALQMDFQGQLSLEQKQTCDSDSNEKLLDAKETLTLLDQVSAVALTDFTSIHKSLEASSEDAVTVSQAKERANEMAASSLTNLGRDGSTQRNSHSGFIFDQTVTHSSTGKNSKFQPIAPSRIIKYDEKGQVIVDLKSNKENIPQQTKYEAYSDSYTGGISNKRNAEKEGVNMMKTNVLSSSRLSHRYPSYGGALAGDKDAIDPADVSANLDSLLSGFFK